METTRYVRIFRVANYDSLSLSDKLDDLMSRMNEILKLNRINEFRQRFNPDREPEFPEDEKYFCVAFKEIKADYCADYEAINELASELEGSVLNLFNILKDFVDQDLDNTLLGMDEDEGEEV